MEPCFLQLHGQNLVKVRARRREGTKKTGKVKRTATAAFHPIRSGSGVPPLSLHSHHPPIRSPGNEKGQRPETIPAWPIGPGRASSNGLGLKARSMVQRPLGITASRTKPTGHPPDRGSSKSLILWWARNRHPNLRHPRKGQLRFILQHPFQPLDLRWWLVFSLGSAERWPSG